MGAFMTDRWEQIERICQSALELGESRRRAFLDGACGGDEELRREVESLLRCFRILLLVTCRYLYLTKALVPDLESQPELVTPNSAVNIAIENFTLALPTIDDGSTVDSQPSFRLAQQTIALWDALKRLNKLVQQFYAFRLGR